MLSYQPVVGLDFDVGDFQTRMPHDSRSTNWIFVGNLYFVGGRLKFCMIQVKLNLLTSLWSL